METLVETVCDRYRCSRWNTTDVLRRKLAIYLEARFPEVWVLVPPGSRRAGPARVTIHVRGGNGYRTAQESAAIPGFKTDEIFRALTERPWSGSTAGAVERVARAMGEREGTGPEDDPLSRSLIREGDATGFARGQSEGEATGYERGKSEGEARGRREERVAMVRAVLRSRGVAMSPKLEEELPALAGDTPAEALMAAALACTDAADFFRRVQESLR